VTVLEFSGDGAGVQGDKQLRNNFKIINKLWRTK